MSYNFAQLMQGKIEGGSWQQDEIEWLVSGIVDGSVSGPQLGAFLMLVRLRGLSAVETTSLTRAMTNSGARLQWSEDERPGIVDKHSTGGVGDKVSLALVPTAAAVGAKVPMISGRALGLTGGTLDKLESVPGFTCAMSPEEMQASLATVGAFIAGQTEDVVPADRLMYAARSDTGTVASLPLITGSILSKKAAEGISGLVMDVKFGRGTFMRTYEEAKAMAESLIATGKGYEMRVVCYLTKMDHPIGRCVGNAVEMAEALQLLNDKGSEQLRELVLQQAGHLLVLAGRSETIDDGAELARAAWNDASALAKLRDIFVNQGVDEGIADRLCQPGDYTILQYLQIMGCAPLGCTQLRSKADGHVTDIDPLKLAEICRDLFNGAGGKDFSAGVEMAVGIGDPVSASDLLATVYHSGELPQKQKQMLEEAIVVSDEWEGGQGESLIREILQ